MPQPSTQTRKRSGSSTSERSAGKTGTRKRISKTGLTWKKFLAAYDRGGRFRFFAASSRWRWLGGRRVTWAARVLDWGKS